MIIDKEGKLFGKFSIVDLLIILVIITASVILVLKFSGPGEAGVPENNKYTYIIKVSSVKKTTAEYIKKGETLYDGEDNCMGKIVEDIKTEPAKKVVSKNDGTFTETVNPERLDVYITIEAEGVKNDNGFYIDGKVPLLKGTQRFFRAPDVDFSGEIIEIIK